MMVLAGRGVGRGPVWGGSRIACRRLVGASWSKARRVRGRGCVRFCRWRLNGTHRFEVEGERSGAIVSREETPVLVEEHAALRRVATLVARGIAQEELFAAVTEEVGRLLPVEFAIMGRYEDDD